MSVRPSALTSIALMALGEPERPATTGSAAPFQVNVLKAPDVSRFIAASTKVSEKFAGLFLVR